MTEKDTKINTDTNTANTAPVIPVAGEATVAVTEGTSKVTLGRRGRGDTARRGGHGGQNSAQGQRGGSRNNRNENRERVKPEFDSKIIDIRRVTRVTSGGRRMNFSVAVVAGDRKGRVGVGLGKSIDTASAVEKATREAKKNLIKIPLSPQMTIPHAVEGKYASARIMIFPARGRGVVAGSSARSVIELAGIKDVCAKFLSGSKNKLNNAKSAIEALSNLTKVSRKDMKAKN
jgi:small subunit ribosomal protein S5